MVIDTPEAAANLNELVESGVVWERGDSVIKYVSADSEVVRRLFEKYSKKNDDCGEGSETLRLW